MMKRLGLKTSAKRKFINKGKSKNDTAKDSKSNSNKIQPQKLKRGGVQMNLEEATKMTKEYIKPFALGMGVGAIVLLIVIFAAGWVVTSSSAEAKAEEMVAEAVLDRLVPIAVTQFMQDPNKEEHLKELKKLESYGTPNRSDYVQKQGWATMPGEKEPYSGVAKRCAEQIMQISK
jgi:hypothetical protein